MGYTMVEKILMHNAGLDTVKTGDIVITKPDMFMVHDIYTPYLVDVLKKMGTKELENPHKLTVVFDHCMPTAVANNDSIHYQAGIELAETWKLDKEKIHIGEGICHTIMHEKRYALPGTVVTATDSHTTTYGGGGCFCSGIGTTEMAAALTTGELWFKVPEAIKVVLTGSFADGSSAKDLILQILSDIKSDGAQYKSMEFVGPAIKELGMDARYTIANMALEAGAKCALFPVDEITAKYFDMELDEISWVHPDDDAEYECILEYDLSKLEPLMACPQGVDNVHPVSEVLGQKVHEVYIGSCTNGSLDDLAVAASYLEGKKVAPHVRFIVAPATNHIYKEAIKKGYIKTFVESGAIIIHPCCGLCCGMPYGLMADDEIIVSTANRNFIGRMGTKKTLIYLSSPAVAAVTAIKGHISSPANMN